MKFLLVALLSYTSSFGQLVEGDGYYGIAKKCNKPTELKFQSHDDIHITQEIKYLGKIESSGKYYKVIVSHKSLGGKGVNDLVFVDRDGTVVIYRIDMPEEAPYKIAGNKLYFALAGKKESVAINIGKLQELLCMPTGCFNKVH